MFSRYSWVEVHREELIKMNSSLEFKLHRLKFVTLLDSGMLQEALQYSKLFGQFANKHKKGDVCVCVCVCVMYMCVCICVCCVCVRVYMCVLCTCVCVVYMCVCFYNVCMCVLYTCVCVCCVHAACKCMSVGVSVCMCL